MSNKIFNSPPGWPTPPQGWVPPAGWQPDPSWPQAPAGWQFWLDAPQQPFTPKPLPQFGQPSLAQYNGQPVLSNITHESPRKKPKTLVIVAASLAVLLFAGIGIVVATNSLSGEESNTTQSGDDTTPAASRTEEEANARLEKSYSDAVDALEGYGNNIDGSEAILEGYNTMLAEGQAPADPSMDMTQIEWLDFSAAGIEEVAAMNEEKHQEFVEEWSTSIHDTSTNETGTQAEEELDKISEGLAYVVVDDFCEEQYASDGIENHIIACVQGSDPHVVHVSNDYVNDSSLNWKSIMRHEYAHVIQLKHYDNLGFSPKAEELFPPTENTPVFNSYDSEHHADCMAQFIQPDYNGGYGGVCSPEQLAEAGKVWDGTFDNGIVYS